MILFPDTNFFLQFYDPAELEWHEVVGDAEAVRLLVCRTVQSEVDGFKGDGRNRRAERARKASGRFRDIILRGKPLVLRERGPCVTLELAPVSGRAIRIRKRSTCRTATIGSWRRRWSMRPRPARRSRC